MPAFRTSSHPCRSRRPLASLLIAVLMLALGACATSTPGATVPDTTPTSLFSDAASPAPAASPTLAPLPGITPASSGPEFTVSVLVDTATEEVTREQAQAAVDQASRFLREFSPIALRMVDYAAIGAGVGSTVAMATSYINLRSASPPDGIVIFSAGDESRARLNGGYGYNLPVASSFKRNFVSPASGDGQIYVAVVDYGYKYMACGYGGSDAPHSKISLPGECRGQTGISCVEANGYSMCSNAVGNLYMSTPTYAVSSMIVHGLLHSFGPDGDQDHYATAQCNARMGYPAGFFDLQESEYYNGLCPFVYEEFTKSYRP